MTAEKRQLETFIDEAKGKIFVNLEDIVYLMQDMLDAGTADGVDTRQTLLLFEWFALQHDRFEQSMKEKQNRKYAEANERIKRLNEKYRDRRGRNGVSDILAGTSGGAPEDVADSHENVVATNPSETDSADNHDR